MTGQPAHTERRVRDFLKAEARRQIVERAQAKAAIAGRKIRRISLRDTRSRWGSCASGGNLNFSWRLVLAPDGVLDYVVAHEVAHLVHMNHSPAFWQTVATLTDADVKAQRAWLRRHGNGLFAYGPLK